MRSGGKGFGVKFFFFFFPQKKTKKMGKLNEYEKRSKQALDTAQLSGDYVPRKGSKSLSVFDPILEPNSPEIKFAKSLANTDAAVRHRTVNALKAYLTARSSLSGLGFSEIELMKLWKGLWYCMWLADKRPVQEELSKRLSVLMHCLSGSEEEDIEAGEYYMEFTSGDGEGEGEGGYIGSDDGSVGSSGSLDSSDSSGTIELEKDEEVGYLEDENYEEESSMAMNMPHCRGAHLVQLFVRSFFQTIRREWGGIDQYRVDKFYTLIRDMIQEVFSYLASRKYHVGLTRLFNDMLVEEVLTMVPNGVRTHVIDLVLDEFIKASSKHK